MMDLIQNKTDNRQQTTDNRQQTIGNKQTTERDTKVVFQLLWRQSGLKPHDLMRVSHHEKC